MPDPRHDLIDARIPDELGYACAEAMGVDAFHAMPPGCDGKAFLVDDNLCLKLTTSKVEAALCARILESAAAGTPVPGAFDVREVKAVTLDDGTAAFAILREEVSEVFVDPGPEDHWNIVDWREALYRLDGGWYLEDDARIEKALNRAPEVARLDRVVASLRHFKDAFGAKIDDLHVENFGRRGDGSVCVRDLSRARYPERMVDEVLARIEPLETTRSLAMP